MTPLLDSIRALLRFLRVGGDPPDLSLELVRDHWLGPLVYLRLGERDHHHRAACAQSFNESFERRVKLESAWASASAALAAEHIPCVTLGSLPFTTAIYPHRAAKLCQDIDLLVAPTDQARARQALATIDWIQRPGRIFLSKGDLQLDLHTLPGDESRFPAIARAYAQETAQLLQERMPIPNGPGHAFMLASHHLLDNRVQHFFKHYCSRLIDALELALLLERIEVNQAQLRAAMDASGSGRVWAFVLELLRRWELPVSVDPTTDVEREFLTRPKVRRILENTALLRAGRSPLKLTAMMMPLPSRMRFWRQVIWPRRNVLLTSYGREDASISEVLTLRIARLAKAAGGAIRGN